MSKDSQVSVHYYLAGIKKVTCPPDVKIQLYDEHFYENSTNVMAIWDANFTNDEHFGELEARDKNDEPITNIRCYLQNGENFEDYSSDKVLDFLKKVDDTKKNQVNKCLKLFEKCLDQSENNPEGALWSGYRSFHKDLSCFILHNNGLKYFEQLYSYEPLDTPKRLEYLNQLNACKRLEFLSFLKYLEGFDSSSSDSRDDVEQVDLAGDVVEHTDNQG